MNHKIKEGIYWVGAIDWDLRDFHGYDTPKGTSYNAYLIVDEKVALIDTVRQGFSHELLSNISGIVDPSKIDYLIVNHLERDHSGSISDVMSSAPKAKVLCSERGRKGLVDWYGEPWPITAVRTNSTLSLGKKTLRFIETPMVHWPDSMFTYAEEDRVLFSSDAFGQHIASSERFDDEMPYDVTPDARTYYANIIMPMSMLVEKLLGRAGELRLDPEIIAPDHGLMWRQPSKILTAYGKWSRFEHGPKVVIAYDTMWGTTEKMARLIADGAMREGVEVKLYNVKKSPISDIVSDIQDAGCLVIGSSTLNNGMLRTVGGLMTYLKGLKPKNKIAAGFGSYGWAGGAVKEITERLKEIGLDTIEPGLENRFTLTKEDESECTDLGRRLAKRIKA